MRDDAKVHQTECANLHFALAASFGWELSSVPPNSYISVRDEHPPMKKAQRKRRYGHVFTLGHDGNVDEPRFGVRWLANEAGHEVYTTETLPSLRAKDCYLITSLPCRSVSACWSGARAHSLAVLFLSLS